MPEDHNKERPKGEARIDTREEYEVRYWCEAFGCTAGQLKEAVHSVGALAEDVRVHLAKRSASWAARAHLGVDTLPPSVA